MNAIFIDFASTYQTTDSRYENVVDDYGRCVSVVRRSGLDMKWVCDYWDKEHMKREDWDLGSIGFATKEFYWVSRNKEPYAFVYEPEN